MGAADSNSEGSLEALVNNAPRECVQKTMDVLTKAANQKLKCAAFQNLLPMHHQLDAEVERLTQARDQLRKASHYPDQRCFCLFFLGF